MKLKLIVLLALLSLISVNLKADTSIFTGNGIGEFNPNSRFKASVGVVDSTSVTSENSAVWTDITNMSYSISVDFRTYDYTSHNKMTGVYDDLKVSGFNLALPFGDKNIIGLSLKPLTYVDYYYINDFEKIEAFEDIASKTMVNRHGSINSLSLIYGKKIKNCSFSFGVGTIFGFLEKEVRTTFKNSDDANSFDDAFYESKLKNNIYHLTLESGFRYKVNNNLSFGGTATIPIKKSGEENSTFSHTYSVGYYQIVDELENNSKDIKDIDWPIYSAFGASYKTGKFNMALDLKYAGFLGMNIGFGKQDNEELSNYYSVASEFSYKYSNKRLIPYYQKIKYKTGIIYEHLANKSSSFEGDQYYNTINITTFKTGFELPYNKNMSRFGLNLYYSLKGNKSDNYFEEKIFKVEVVISGSSNWWLRKKRYND